MTVLVKKVFISSKPSIVCLLCPPPCGPFSIQESAVGGLSYKVKKECALAHSRAEARLLRQPSTPAPSAHPRSAFLFHRTHFPMKWCRGQKPPTLMPTDCSVLRTPTILPDSRISWDYHPTFMLLSGRVTRSFTHLWASSCGLRPFAPGI